MELLVATAIGMMTSAGVYLILRRRVFAVVLGMTMLSYAINVFLFASGRLRLNAPPLLDSHGGGAAAMTDPLPQALVLTAIVISFAMTAVIVMMGLGAFIEGGDDRVDMPRHDRHPPPKVTQRAQTAPRTAAPSSPASGDGAGSGSGAGAASDGGAPAPAQPQKGGA